jgi:hypothetical protein
LPSFDDAITAGLRMATRVKAAKRSPDNRLLAYSAGAAFGRLCQEVEIALEVPLDDQARRELKKIVGEAAQLVLRKALAN